MSDVAKWLSETTFCDCEEWCVHAEVQRLAAQQHEELASHVCTHPLGPAARKRCSHCRVLQSAKAFKERYE